MRNGIGVEPHHLLANLLLLGAGVVLFIHSIREQKLRSPLWGVALSRGTATAGRMSRPSSLPSAIARERERERERERDPSSPPKRRRKAAGITTAPLLPTLLVLWGV